MIVIKYYNNIIKGFDVEMSQQKKVKILPWSSLPAGGAIGFECDVCRVTGHPGGPTLSC